MYQGKKVACLIMAAGHGTRMGKGRAKQFREVGGKTVLERTLLAFAGHPSVDDILIVASEEERPLCEALGLARGNGKFKGVAPGGETREDSVWNGLKLLSLIRGDESSNAPRDTRDIVLVQDAARPFTSNELIDRVIRAVNEYGAAIPTVPVRDTVKVTEGEWITGTLPREQLQGAQTPQGFDRRLLTDSMRKGRKKQFHATDDSSYVERFGGTVRKVPGDVRNIKITTIEDMATAELLARIKDEGYKASAAYFLTGRVLPEEMKEKISFREMESSAPESEKPKTGEMEKPAERTEKSPAGASGGEIPNEKKTVGTNGQGAAKAGKPDAAERPENAFPGPDHRGIPAERPERHRPPGPLPPPMIPRIGEGYDVHVLVPDRKLILGGVNIPYEKGLLGHSDADVMTHALMDALLGAAGLGDIGHLFPDSDPAYEGVYSLALLEVVRRLLEKNGFMVGNIDVTLTAQRPKIAPYIEQIRRNYARVLRIPEDRVNAKATTTERLGFVGREEGMAATATVLLFSLLPPPKKPKGTEGKPSFRREHPKPGTVPSLLSDDNPVCSPDSGWTHLEF